MINKLLGGPIGLLIGVAVAISLVVGALTYVVQARDNGGSVAAVSLRLHDELVSWPNHSALQREAVASVNDDAGQTQIRNSIASGDSLESVEASSLGDPASVEIVARASEDSVAIAAADAAAQLAIDQSLSDRQAPLLAQVSALSADLDVALGERDALLAQLATGIDDDTERAVATASVESLAGVASVLEQDIARIEADLNANTAPLLTIGDAQLETQSGNDLNSALAAALGALFLSLLGLSLIRDRNSEASGGQTIDLTDTDVRIERELATAGAGIHPASVE